MNQTTMKHTAALMSASLLLGLASCGDDDYEPGRPTAEGCECAYFDADNQTDFIFSADDQKETLVLSVSRRNTDGEADVPIRVVSADTAAIRIPASVHFPAGEATAELTVTFAGLYESRKYGFRIAIADEAADHYSVQGGVTYYQGSVTIATWKKVLENVRFYCSQYNTLGTYYSDVYQLDGVNRFYIQNFLESGIDLHFTVNGTFNLATLEDCAGEIVPVAGQGTTVQDYGSYKLFYPATENEDGSYNYAWYNDALDIYFYYFCWYNGADFSYIDLNRKYILLDGYASAVYDDGTDTWPGSVRAYATFYGQW